MLLHYTTVTVNELQSQRLQSLLLLTHLELVRGGLIVRVECYEDKYAEQQVLLLRTVHCHLALVSFSSRLMPDNEVEEWRRLSWRMEMVRVKSESQVNAIILTLINVCTAENLIEQSHTIKKIKHNADQKRLIMPLAG